MSKPPSRKAAPYRAGTEKNETLIVTTSNDIEGRQISDYLGIVRGLVVRSPSIGQGLVGAFKSMGGGNIDEWSKVCEAARHDAYTRMIEHAQHLGADAIIGMRYDATEFMQGATEVLAYGTAVKIAPR